VFPLADQIGEASNTGFSAFSASWNGTLVYQSGREIAIRELVWRDRSGKLLGTITKPDLIYSPALSPDERRLAYSWVTRVHRWGIFGCRTWRAERRPASPSARTSENIQFGLPTGRASLLHSAPLRADSMIYTRSRPAAQARSKLLLHGGTNAYASDWSATAS